LEKHNEGNQSGINWASIKVSVDNFSLGQKPWGKKLLSQLTKICGKDTWSPEARGLEACITTANRCSCPARATTGPDIDITNVCKKENTEFTNNHHFWKKLPKK
jgi:hypothetical protein